MSDHWTLEIPEWGTVVAYRSPRDGVMIIDIDNSELEDDSPDIDEQLTPRARISLNDGYIYENPEYPYGEDR